MLGATRFGLTGSSPRNTLFKGSTALCTFVSSVLNVRCYYFYVMGYLFFLSPYCGCFVPHWVCRSPWLCVSCVDI
jgi:hypothetical protein